MELQKQSEEAMQLLHGVKQISQIGELPLRGCSLFLVRRSPRWNSRGIPRGEVVLLAREVRLGLWKRFGP